MKCLPLFCAALALTFTFAGCKKQDENNAAVKRNVNPNEVVASVDGVKYLRKDLDVLVEKVMTIQNIPQDQREEAREYFEANFITEFVKKTLLLNEATAQGIVVTDEDRAEMLERITPMLEARNITLEQYFQTAPLGEEFTRAEFEKGLIFDKLLKEKVTSQIIIADEDVAAMLETMTQANAQAVEANAKVAEENKLKLAQIEQLKKELAEGADFEALAKEHSACPSGQGGGALGTFARGQMVKPFEDAAFEQEVGKVGNVIETQFGYHLIKVTEKTPATAETEETVAASHILLAFAQETSIRPLPSEDDIRAHLTEQRSRAAAQEYLSTLQSKAAIESIVPIDAD